MNIDGLAGTAALCGWAAGETGAEELRATAAADAAAHARLLVRPDGSTWQTVALDRATGRVLRRHTQKGLADGTTWARGQAWAMLGFAQAAHWLDPALATSARATADWWCAATDGRRVPPWDFADPDGVPDTSAAAIAARALLALADLPGIDAVPYQRAAHETVAALVSAHLTADGDRSRPAGMLLAGCYNHHAPVAPRHELIWGDWFLLDALLAITKDLGVPWPP